MHNSSEVMKIALRVLKAVSQKHAAAPSDVAELEHHAGPKPHSMALDEFACQAIQDALKHRANRRAQHK